MLTAHHLHKSYNLNPILKDVSFSVNPGERVGLIGPNGCGKTTLLRLIVGEEPADSGHIQFTPATLRIGYLPQGLEPPPGETLTALLRRAGGDPHWLEAELIQLAQALVETPEDPDLQNRYDQTLTRMQRPFDPGRLMTIERALGLTELPPQQIAATLSGGQKTRLSLARVLLSDPQLLLLDEPTNHLDIGMLEWLEDWLADFAGAALIVSHDRVFLERSVNRVLDLNPEHQTIRAYTGGYSDYLEQVTRAHEQQWAAYHDQVAEIRRMRQDIARTRAQAERTEREASSIRIGGGEMKIKGAKSYQQGIAKKVARKAKSRAKKLERYLDEAERVEKPKAGWQIKLEFEQPEHLSQQVMALEALSVGYPGYAPLLSGLNLTVQAGARIVLTGANGSGKTTLLRTIAGQLAPVAGAVRLGGRVRLGYMAQEQETLDPHLTAVETLQAVARLSQTEIRNFLHHYLFSGDDALRPVELLSYGERSRLMLARLVAQGCDFLLLDEPINHLDIPSRERFEQALADFPGTILAVVHDRYFIQRFASQVWLLEDGLCNEPERETEWLLSPLTMRVG